MFRLLNVPLYLALGMSIASIAGAEIADLEWFEVEVVDTDASDVSTPSGASVLKLGDTWHVVYERDGEIYHRARDESGWGDFERLSHDPGLSRRPHLGANLYLGQLHVVWEDDRTGHLEVWTRRLIDGQWSPEECLSCDDVPSEQPDISGEGGGNSDDEVLAAWTDVGDPRRVMARLYQDASWGPVEEVSTGTGIGEPSVVGHRGLNRFSVVWSDRTGPEPTLHFRRRAFHPSNPVWSDPEFLATGRSPSAHAEFYGGGLPHFDVSFEFPFATPGAGRSGRGKDDPYVTEVFYTQYTAGASDRVSPNDGIPSGRPNLAGFLYSAQSGGGRRLFTAWTDSLPGGELRHVMANYPYPDTVLISNAGLSDVAVGAVEGDPWAEVMVVWMEDRDGSPTLLARRGQLPGCWRAELQGAPSLIVGPEGNPPNTLFYVDGCLGEPVGGNLAVWIDFSPDLDEDITWDPDQPHPTIIEFADSNDGGRVVFSIRAGGCSQAGTATATEPVDFSYRVWDGVRSPDVNGDCQVTGSDLAYVQALLGSDDFCADIDGSGLVDESDVDIVVATMGDECSEIVGVDGMAIPTTPRVRVHPNPASARATIAIDLPAAAAVRVRVFDVAGRQVRDLDAGTLSAGASGVGWDLLDEGGRRAAPGAYFARIEIGHEVRWAKLWISR